jgi:hypothetical protein
MKGGVDEQQVLLKGSVVVLCALLKGGFAQRSVCSNVRLLKAGVA